MKWGVRRSDEELDRAAGRKPRDRSIFKKKAKEATSKSSSDSEPERKIKTVKDLSTDELQAVVNRIRLEKQYSELTTPQKVPDTFVKALLKETGKSLARDIALKKAVPLASRALDKKLDDYLKSKGKEHLRAPKKKKK